MTGANLIAVTQPVDPEIKTLTEYIAYVARVSNPSNQYNHETADKLIDYLIRNRHWSPFEMAHITLEVWTTRDIARQMLRHKSFAFQEFSQRYATVDMTEFWNVELRHPRMKDPKNRQNSLPPTEEEKDWVTDRWIDAQRRVMQVVSDAYKSAIEKGIAPEVARAILPEGLTPSVMYVTGNLRSWMHYIEVRTHKSTQLEHRRLAVSCANAIHKVFPRIKQCGIMSLDS